MDVERECTKCGLKVNKQNAIVVDAVGGENGRCTLENGHNLVQIPTSVIQGFLFLMTVLHRNKCSFLGQCPHLWSHGVWKRPILDRHHIYGEQMAPDDVLERWNDVIVESKNEEKMSDHFPNVFYLFSSNHDFLDRFWKLFTDPTRSFELCVNEPRKSDNGKLLASTITTRMPDIPVCYVAKWRTTDIGFYCKQRSKERRTEAHGCNL